MIRPVVDNIVDVIVESVRPQRVILFGSRVRQDYREDSDYDFMVVKNDVKNEREISRKIYKALFTKKIKQSVDIVVVDSKKLKNNLQNSCFIYSSAVREGTVLYG